MQIEQENLISNNKKKGAKTGTIIGVLIFITIIALIVIIVAIMSLQEKKLSVVINGQAVSLAEDTIVFSNDR